MPKPRPIHPDFRRLLDRKDTELIDLFTDARSFILELPPDSNELLYHTHALTSVFTVAEKLSGAFCMLPVYTAHVNLGVNKGTLLEDPRSLLKGTGRRIRQIPVSEAGDYRNTQVKALVNVAMACAVNDLDVPRAASAKTISRIR